MVDKYDSNRIVKETYRHLEEYTNNFECIKDVPSDLMYGDLKNNSEYVFLTVIIPTYNRDSLFEEALKSVLKQNPVSFKWEVIVVDNTELDTCGETPALRIVKEFNDKRVFYYHNRVNVSSGYNWNRGVELARGKWITFLHDDDVLCTSALTELLNIISKYSNLKKSLGYIHARNCSFRDNFDEADSKFIRLPFELELTRFTTLILGHTHTGMPTCGTTILKKAYMEAGGINYDFGPTADAVLGYLIMSKYTVLRSGRILGGYRWINNETLKLSTIKKLIVSDALFAEYRYNTNTFSRCFGNVFGKMQVFDNIKSKIRVAEKWGLKEGEAEELRLYIQAPHPLVKCIYYFILFITKIFMCIKGVFMYRFS